MPTVIKDENGREILRISDDGEFVIARYPDMTEEMKDYIVKLHSQLTSDESKEDEVRDFLNFGGEEEEFCS